jgi:hypothetical protein
VDAQVLQPRAPLHAQGSRSFRGHPGAVVGELDQAWQGEEVTKTLVIEGVGRQAEVGKVLDTGEVPQTGAPDLAVMQRQRMRLLSDNYTSVAKCSCR